MCPERVAVALTVLLLLAGQVLVGVPADPVDRDYTIAAVGDIAVCEALEGARQTMDLIARIQATRVIDAVLTLGDNSNGNGTTEDYRNCFEPTWGRVSNIRPAPGNHDDYDKRPGLGHDGAAYYEYFRERAGPAGLGYYSFNLGRFAHFVSLNSEAPRPRQAAQLAWLKDDLDRHDRPCTLAYFHRPMISSGEFAAGRMKDFWEVLYPKGVDVVLNGHEHFYERLEPMNPLGTLDRGFGIRQFIVGTGGAGFHSLHRWSRQSVRRVTGIFGVLVMTFRPNYYLWEFIDIYGVRHDAGVESCHGRPNL